MVDCYEYPTSSVSNTSNYKHKISHIECLEERLNSAGGTVDLSEYITFGCANAKYAPINHAHGAYASFYHTHNDYALTGHTHNCYITFEEAVDCFATKMELNNYALSGHDHAGLYACVDHGHCEFKCISTRLKRLECIVKAYDEYLSNITPDLHLQQMYPPCSIYYAPTIYYQSSGGQTYLETKGLKHWSESESSVAAHENTVISE